MWRLLQRHRGPIAYTGPVKTGTIQPSSTMPKQSQSVSGFTPKDWVNLAEGPTRETRRRAIQYFTEANGITIEDFHEQALVESVNLYESVNRMIESRKGKARGSIAMYRQRIELFYKAMQYPSYNPELFKQRVRKIAKVTEGKVGTIPFEQMGSFLRGIEDPLLQGFVKFLVDTGCRRQEAETTKVRDIDWATTPVRVSFSAGKTKTGVSRASFLSNETVQLLKRVLGPSPDPEKTIFPYGTKGVSYHKIMRELRHSKLTENAKAGEEDQLESWTITPHYFRTYARHFLVNHGFGEKEADWLIGHEIGVDAAYMDIEELSKKWTEKAEPFIHYLTGPVAETPKAIRLVGPMILQASKPTGPPSNVELGKVVGAEKVSPQDPIKLADEVATRAIDLYNKRTGLQEPQYPMKPPPPVDTGPSVKAKEVTGPHAIPDGASYRCSEGDANGYSKETVEKHIRRMHPPPDKNKLEGWT